MPGNQPSISTLPAAIFKRNRIGITISNTRAKANAAWITARTCSATAACVAFWNRAKPFGVIVSDTAINGRDGVALPEAEILRRDRIKRPTRIANHPLSLRLATAADPFIVRRDQDRYTILAGYHWFTDWGRDTMIALPGLCLGH